MLYEQMGPSMGYGTYHTCVKSLYLNVPAHLLSGAKSLAWGLDLHLLTYFVCKSSEGAGETAQMRSLARAFSARICEKHQTPITSSNENIRGAPNNTSILFFIISTYKLKVLVLHIAATARRY